MNTHMYGDRQDSPPLLAPPHVRVKQGREEQEKERELRHGENRESSRTFGLKPFISLLRPPVWELRFHSTEVKVLVNGVPMVSLTRA